MGSSVNIRSKSDITSTPFLSKYIRYAYILLFMFLGKKQEVVLYLFRYFPLRINLTTQIYSPDFSEDRGISQYGR